MKIAIKMPDLPLGDMFFFRVFGGENHFLNTYFVLSTVPIQFGWLRLNEQEQEEQVRTERQNKNNMVVLCIAIRFQIAFLIYYND